MSEYVYHAISYNRRKILGDLPGLEGKYQADKARLAEDLDGIERMRAALAEYDEWLAANPVGAA